MNGCGAILFVLATGLVSRVFWGVVPFLILWAMFGISKVGDLLALLVASGFIGFFLEAISEGIYGAMAKTNKKKIKAYCEKHGVQIPAGFERHRSASRYAIIRLDVTPPKLIALTWFTQADVIHHIESVLLQELGDDLNAMLKILDFKEGRRLRYVKHSLRESETFDLE